MAEVSAMTLFSLFSSVLGGNVLPRMSVTSPPNPPQGFLPSLSGTQAAALAGISLLNSACSAYEGQAPTLISITGGVVGMTTIFLLSRRLRGSAPAAALPPAENNGHAVDNSRKTMGELTAAIERNPGDKDAHYERGLARERSGDHQGAIEDFSRMLEIEPNSARILVRRGTVKLDSGDVRGAIEDHTLAAAIDPGYAGAYFHRALAHEAAGEWDQARENYLAAKKKGGHGGIGIFADRGLRELEKKAPAS